jgi:DNA-binding NtrC family response regulator
MEFIASKPVRLAEDEDVAARSAGRTLITGSRATDVEWAARRIHAASSRAAATLIVVSAGALPSDPAELRKVCATVIEAAPGGTLLLTGVENMSSMVQEQLLETLAQLQGMGTPSSGIRIMAATTVHLRERVANSTFSDRLFYRLNVIHVVLKDGATDTSRS